MATKYQCPPNAQGVAPIVRGGTPMPMNQYIASGPALVREQSGGSMFSRLVKKFKDFVGDSSTPSVSSSEQAYSEKYGVHPDPIWHEKTREFWQCGPGSVWRKPILLIWYLCAVYVAYLVLRYYVGPYATANKQAVISMAHDTVESSPLGYVTTTILKHASVGSEWTSTGQYSADGVFVGDQRDLLTYYRDGGDLYDEYY